MADIQHAALDYTENHVAHAYEYANTAQREGATGFVAGDIGKLALQTDDKSLWMLSTTAPVWLVAILTGTITVDTIEEDTPGAGVTIDGVLCKDSAVTASSGFTGALTGAVTGNVTGDVTGDITGDLYAANAEKVIDSGATADAADFLDSSGYSRLIPSGGIILWSGTKKAIPDGWYLCDGNNSTPNLTDRFVIHADVDADFIAFVTDFAADANQIDAVGHKLLEDDVIQVQTTGTLPAGLVVSTDYYLINVLTNSFELSLTPAPGTPIVLTSDGVGDQTFQSVGDNSVGATGGSTNTGGTALTEAQLAAHDHPITAYSGTTTTGGLVAINAIESDNTSRSSFVDNPISAGNAGSGATHLHTVLPKYYALAYIMKA